ncbi:uncharacterized protein J8A68_001560 [[Candida] subhashii]|uniref:Ubiquitin-protein ligase E3A N-terminal zinc-binding domain-containing protein n=1 Tax=[Candida] subhashii TaxID=561895 RepID=A0A8J5URU3_9ASCO|nr:uncharacterized protein J8A68_001560 [[Candida] subhashii]KAG7664922.1 hypothetical protein J8A68_001560 [[Candida] subhashii]
MNLQFRLTIDQSDSRKKLKPYSDKIILSPSILSQIIDQIPESELPHPLIFKITNIDDYSKSAYVGVKEFSATEDNTIILPNVIYDKLNSPNEVRIELQQHIPKATSLKLKPCHFYSNITNWKFFLENKLNQYYTTLTNKDTLIIEDDNLRYELIIDEINNESEKRITACIIDTDITLDLIPLSDKIANEQLLEFNSSPYNKITEIERSITIHGLKSFLNPKFVPNIYKIDLLNRKGDFVISIKNCKYDPKDLDTVVNIDFIVGLDKFVTLENFNYSTMDEDLSVERKLARNGHTDGRKIVQVCLNEDLILSKLQRMKNEDSDETEQNYLYLIPFTWDTDADVEIEIYDQATDEEEDIDMNEGEDSRECPNCLKPIPKQQFPLHETFCLRNNVRCTKCNSVFLKKIPDYHWHCDKCVEFYANTPLLEFKHKKLHHMGPYTCHSCPSTDTYDNFFELVIGHKARLCPAKLHQCRFCHLVVPQEESTYQDRFENLTHHENSCGNKTNECYKCGKILRTKDFKKHIKLHDLEKLEFNQMNKIIFNKCCNENCIRLIKSEDPGNELGLCDICYGPLYIQQNDPNHLKLQIRIERKYMIQLSKGCGNHWCNNEYCKTGNKRQIEGKSFRELMELLNQKLFKFIISPRLPINKSQVELSASANKMWFCVNESVSNKKVLFDLLKSEGEYEEEIIYKAINDNNDEYSIRSWLQENGISRDQKI